MSAVITVPDACEDCLAQSIECVEVRDGSECRKFYRLLNLKFANVFENNKTDGLLK